MLTNRIVELKLAVPTDFPGTDDEYQGLMEEIFDRYGNAEYWTVSCERCGDGDHFTSQCKEVPDEVQTE